MNQGSAFDDTVEAAPPSPPLPDGPSTAGAGLWKALTAVLAVVCIGLAAALTRPVTEAAPRAIATVTVTASAAAPETAAAEPSPPTPELEQWLLAIPRRVADDPRAKGDVDAAVVLTEWADYRCPYCSVWAEDTLPLLQPLVDEGVLRIEFRDLAIFGDDSVNAAAGARAAGEQGLFWEFQHELFVATPNQGHPPVGDDLVDEIARQVGVPDMDRFTADYLDPATREAVLADSAEARELGISSTPTFLVGTEVIAGAQPLEVFEAVISEQAARHG